MGFSTEISKPAKIASYPLEANSPISRGCVNHLKYLSKDKFDFYLKVVLAFNRNQLAESPKSPNDSISCGTLLDTPPQGSNNLSFSTESKVKQRGVASDTWLPTGWLIKDRGRSSDARPGLVDKYYVDPSSGRKFRSKKKVLYYLETGTPQPKRKKGTETPVGEEVGSPK
ncbi:hypothetical protein ES332_D07G115100v1 [Gossypium tomentosum]|uniref:MBD domain-containing protein n=2 Tax=Gossypium TaxID=3633 RepID=A0A5D2K641_GOSTO|nr:hypothetical protein ES332_D07G115100v1 [Gossypium tomentosum]